MNDWRGWSIPLFYHLGRYASDRVNATGEIDSIELNLTDDGLAVAVFRFRRLSTNGGHLDVLTYRATVEHGQNESPKAMAKQLSDDLTRYMRYRRANVLKLMVLTQVKRQQEPKPDT